MNMTVKMCVPSPQVVVNLISLSLVEMLKTYPPLINGFHYNVEITISLRPSPTIMVTAKLVPETVSIILLFQINLSPYMRTERTFHEV